MATPFRAHSYSRSGNGVILEELSASALSEPKSSFKDSKIKLPGKISRFYLSILTRLTSRTLALAKRLDGYQACMPTRSVVFWSISISLTRALTK